jgi:signal transduction histidine kinase
MRPPEALGRFLGSWHSDAVLAVGLGLGGGLYAAATGVLSSATADLVGVLGLGAIACIVFRRRYPRSAAIAAGCLLGLGSLGSAAVAMPDGPPLVAICLLAYSLGTGPVGNGPVGTGPVGTGPVGTGDGLSGWSVLAWVCLALGTQMVAGITVFNPFIVVATVGAFGLGLVVRSRRRITDQLAARGLELESERELFAAEAIRYERARIARELHDIVAHCISVMVIQAGAGQRLAARDPALAAEAFDAIAESVKQAEAEIGRLVELLDHDPGPHAIDGIGLVNELVARAAATGLSVSCRIGGLAERVPEQASEAVYRVVQESLTNALKHAPGAPVEIVIAEADGELEVSICNGPSSGPSSGLELTGGGRGVAGMRDRVRACGGELSAGPVGPADGGGWRVLARLPLTRRASATAG